MEMSRSPSEAVIPLSFRLFSGRCDNCGEYLKKDDYVMRARDRIFHTHCFRCAACERQLVPGDEFAVDGPQLMCKEDHTRIRYGSNGAGNNNNGVEDSIKREENNNNDEDFEVDEDDEDVVVSGGGGGGGECVWCVAVGDLSLTPHTWCQNRFCV